MNTPWWRFWGPRRASEEPDELLGRVQKGVVAALGILQQQLGGLDHRLKLLDESSTEARKLEQRLARAETLASSTRSLLEDHVTRLDQAVATLRGQMTGGTRGARGRSGSAAESLGSDLLALLGPENAAALVREIQERGVNGALIEGSPVAGD